HGFICIHKPATWTSHDVVGYLRKVTRIKKIGHAGTLDPFATGLLLVAIGREATSRISEFTGLPKTYRATLVLGATSDTQDSTGIISYTAAEKKASQLTLAEIKNVLKQFCGEQNQIPPMYSAKKIQGEKLYDLARKGKEIERTPKKITVFRLELCDDLVRQDDDTLRITVEADVSSGTYIRTLANDIGEQLGVGAYCDTLIRTHIGPFHLLDAQPLETITPEIIQQHIFHV
ncbi:MAG: tRNA pseudouridine(55) synthase TruB, partial [Candidatus Magasanikbacteria bacterium]|nr:tRNA pseudouridine(55) synthase TruB [Candidatus Magasanikbacteria bacterium]